MPNTYIFTSNGTGMDFQSDTQRALYVQDLKENVGKKYKIERIVPVRSLSQNAFYWAYLGTIEKETGNLANDLHEYFKRTLLPPKFINVMGKEIKIPASTTDLTKVQFGEYLDKISAESGVPLPTREELEAMGYILNY